jgi:hypothetical protein
MEAYHLEVYFEAFDDTGGQVAAVGWSDMPLLIRICEDRLSCDFPDLGDMDPDEDHPRLIDASP